MIRLMIVDDHELTRQDAVKQLTAVDVIEVVGQAETSDEALKLAQQLLPDIILLDVHLPGLLSTDDLLKRLTALPRVKVIIFASEGRAWEVQDLLAAGAAGYVLKTDPAPLIRMSMVMVSKGSKGMLSPSIPRNVAHLSQEERAMLHQMTRRSGLAKAAERLNMTEEVVSNIAEQLTAKLELDDTEQLAKWAKKQGF